ncbi:MAG: glycoside hydrolase family 3 C-terminal domain-containing protein [Bacteroidales bacterium]|nr:glycoside hydrolase family 3 C-terminal domain-containing protein [Bacteroidales bacterium]
MKKTLLLIGAILCTLPMLAQPKLKADNIDEVLKAMTLEEKALLSCGRGWGMQLGGITGSAQILVPGAAGTTNAIPRLGIPATALPDGPAGIRINPTREGTTQTYYGTGFPVGTAIASSWDVELVENMTKAMGNEVLEYGADVLLAPGMNLHRNPLCGRNFEYFSEDPVVTGKIAAAYVKGIQSNGVGVSIKHFAANSQELNRNENDAIVSTRALRELYLKGFEIAVKDADPWTVMSSYNKLNGEYTQQSHDLLQKILRDDWGFKGIVMTDWGNKEGTVKAVYAGNDLMMPGSDVEQKRIVEAVKNGQLSMDDLDRNVRRILQYIVKTPHFRNYKYSDKPNLKAHAQAARAAATESMVLLKNEGESLPLASGKKVALFGASSVDFVAGGTGSGNVNKAYVIGLNDGLEHAGYVLDPVLKDYYQKYVDFKRVEMSAGSGAGSVLLGARKVPEAPLSRNFIDARVAGNDVAVVVIGRNSGEGADRRVDDDFNLTAAESQLLNDVCNAFHLAGKKVVVVLNIGGVIETNSWKNLPDAILLAWQPGQEGGDAVADVLSGKVNPSGKLTMTFPNTYMDHPSSLNFPRGTEQRGGGNMWGMRGGAPQKVKNLDYTNYDEDIWVGYRWFNTQNKAVSYPFGFGLSYTTFEYSKPVVKATSDGFTASVVVKNTGKVAGKEVVEVYVSAPKGGLEKPSRELKAFAKTKLLKPGESQTLTFKVSAYELASFNSAANQWETAAGEYTVFFAKNANCKCSSAKFSIKNPATFAVSNAYVK